MLFARNKYFQEHFTETRPT